ncbi:hypothetical protein C4J85_3541 [Pseudomonas sp. R4-34-07]|nr:hypothetical protein C4J85_3541 [Pseudomonas sp. R4-34-07]
MNQVTDFKQWPFSDQILHEYVTYLVLLATRMPLMNENYR